MNKSHSVLKKRILEMFKKARQKVQFFQFVKLTSEQQIMQHSVIYQEFPGISVSLAKQAANLDFLRWFSLKHKPATVTAKPNFFQAADLLTYNDRFFLCKFVMALGCQLAFKKIRGVWRNVWFCQMHSRTLKIIAGEKQ